MPRTAILFLALAMILSIGAAIAQDAATETLEADDTAASEEDTTAAEEDTGDDAEFIEVEGAGEAEEEEGPRGIISAETEDDAGMSPAVPDATPEPADTGAPLLAYVLIGGALLAAGIFLMRRTAAQSV